MKKRRPETDILILFAIISNRYFSQIPAVGGTTFIEKTKSIFHLLLWKCVLHDGIEQLSI